MKIIIALLMTISISLSLMACGENNVDIDNSQSNIQTSITTEPETHNADTITIPETEAITVMDKNDTANYIGVWETANFRLTITKGGVGRYENLGNSGEYYDLDWDVKDEVLITKISFVGMEHKAVLELNEDASSLVVLQVGFPVYIKDEDTFSKKQ